MHSQQRNSIYQEEIKQELFKLDFLRNMIKEHELEYGTLLPHVFLGDLARWLDKALTKGKMDNIEDISQIIEKLYMNGSEDTKEAIIVSFLENLQKLNHNKLSRIKQYLPPNIKNKLREMVNEDIVSLTKLTQ